jgi:hypothetical protein
MGIYRNPAAERNNRLWANACCQVAAYTYFIFEAIIVFAYTLRSSNKLM